MVSVLLQAGCDKNAKMGTPATITPLNLATQRYYLSVVLVFHGKKKSNCFHFISTHEILVV